MRGNGLIGEVGDFSKFSPQSEIMKLAGLDLYEISSGKRKGLRRISKRGRSLLRKILFYAAIQMIRKNGIMYEYYVRLTGRGMERMRALIAVSRKLLGIICHRSGLTETMWVNTKPPKGGCAKRLPKG